MKKNPTPKKTVKTTKPTQPTISPKQWKVVETQLKYLTGRIEQVGVLANNVAEISDRVADCRRELSALLPAPEPKEPEPWVPKVGDWVVVINVQNPSGIPVRVDSTTTTHLGYRVSTGCYYALSNLRPASQAEIDAHLEAEAIKKQEAEWAAITELQDMDACEMTTEERASFAKEFASIAHGGFGDYQDYTHVYWNGRRGHLDSSIGSLGDSYNYYLFPEFLRRAKGTAARLEAERKAEEAQAPIEFGTRVLYRGEQWRVACDGPGKFDSYYIVKPIDSGTTGYHARRSEFTVISPKP